MTVEKQCEDCSYGVSSMTAGRLTPAARSFPESCPQCGGDLVNACDPADEDDEEQTDGLSEEERQRIKEDPVLDLSDVDEETGEIVTDGGQTPLELAEQYRDEIAGQWDEADPDVLAFDGDARPVVAFVEDELRMLSARLLHPRVVDLDDLAAAIETRGEPEVRSLSTFSARFDRDHFEDVDEADDQEIISDGGMTLSAGLFGRSTPDGSGSPIVQGRFPADVASDRGCQHSDGDLPCPACFFDGGDA